MSVTEAAPAPSAAAPARPPAKAASTAAARAPLNGASVAREDKARSAAPAAAERRPGSPADQCAGLGFFGTSRCMAAQCAKPAYAAHAACEAVRRQQQLMEEKRNPSLNR
jgi:hypothetical protein